MRMSDMHYALTDFCIEQDENETVFEDTAAEMVGGLLEYCDKRLYPARIAAGRINRYGILVNGREDSGIMPEDVKDGDILCENGVILCCIADKNIHHGSARISSGYDAVYDRDRDRVRLFRKVMICGSGIFSVYRTECERIENYNFFTFYGELASQIKAAVDEALSA